MARNHDLEILEFMLRKIGIHGILSEIFAERTDIRNELKHELIASAISKKVDEFSKSPYKSLNDEEREKQLRHDYASVLHVIKYELPDMIKGYRPCEDCLYYHQYMNAVIHEEEKFGKYCALHDWGNDAGMFKVKEIKQCKKDNWKDYYNRKPEDLEDRARFMTELKAV